MNKFFMAVAKLALLASVCALTGCKTTDTAKNGSLASIVISGHSVEEVKQTTVEVFGWDGYKQVSDLTFE